MNLADFIGTGVLAALAVIGLFALVAVATRPRVHPYLRIVCFVGALIAAYAAVGQFYRLAELT